MVEMKEIDIDDMKFQLWPLPAKDQFHVFRRVAPLLAGLGEGFSAVASESGEDAEMNDSNMVKLMTPLFDVLSKMEDSACDYIIDKCLNRVRIFNGMQWVPLTVGGRIQFEDKIDMTVMMRLTVEMLTHNGAISFLLDGPASSLPNGAAAAGPLSN